MEKIGQFLIDLMVSYREIEGNMWLLDDSALGLEGIVVAYTDPLVIIQADVMDVPDVPKEKQLEFFTLLLELNARDLTHGAYALENGKIVILDTLEYEGMDYNEFRASLDAISLALSQHYPVLSKYRA